MEKFRKTLVIIGSMLLLTTASCAVQNKKENKIRNLSLEESYEKNLTNSILMTGWYYISDIDSGFARQLDRTDEFYTINPFPIVTAEDVTMLSIEKDNWGGVFLSMRFGKEGTERWRVATGRSIGKKLAFIVNDKLLYVPQVHSEITAGVSALSRIDYSKEDYERAKQAIENNKKEMQRTE